MKSRNMWILTAQQSGGETYYLIPGKEYTVGRKNCDVLLPNDQSISRAHAHLTATDQSLTLKDSSKYGTSVNNQKLTTPVNLMSGDDVTFGVFNSKFTVSHQKPVVSSSCLDNARKASLSQALAAVGGKLVNTWSHDCTHLTMPTVKVTIKTISALLCCRPIVKPEFFSELNNAVLQKLPPPKAESFLPEIDEPSLNAQDVNLGIIPLRKQLFHGKLFLFLTSKQLKRLSAAVSFGGGESQLLVEGSLPRDLLESPHSCLVDVTTGSSQNLLPPSATEWANSVRSILQRKGLRVITESEIGLAAIYASCDKYCNPSCPSIDSDSAPQLKPRIPSATLSQSVAVDETVLPAASQNVTAYAVNTETSQRMEASEVTGVLAVGETPEKNRTQNTAQFCGSKLTVPSVVAETPSSSFGTADDRGSQRKKPDAKLTGGGVTDAGPQSSSSKTHGGVRMSFYKHSPQKPRATEQTSPQKQSTLTSFFQPVKKKRPLEDELSAVMSEPKRPAPESSVAVQDSNASAPSKEMPPLTSRIPPAVSDTHLESPADLFLCKSEEKPQGQKRKAMEEEIQIEELESIMSEDCFDDRLPNNQGQREQLTLRSSTKEKPSSGPAESFIKRKRTHQDELGTIRQKTEENRRKDSRLQKTGREQSEHHIVSIKTEPLQLNLTAAHRSDEAPETSAASTSKDIKRSDEDDASFIEDEELLQIDISQPGNETKMSVKPVQIKQEDQESKINEDLSKKLVLVEFRSLTVTAPTKAKPKPVQENGHVRNFKCFQKKHVPGSDGFPHIIGGSDLLVHNRGQNTDLDEWLKDAAEEERQNRRDETLGDDLFRYNPTKLTKRR